MKSYCSHNPAFIEDTLAGTWKTAKLNQKEIKIFHPSSRILQSIYVKAGLRSVLFCSLHVLLCVLVVV